MVDGTVRIKSLIEKAAELGMPAIAVTDQHNLFALVKFYRAAEAAGIKPIIGIEAYVAQGSRRNRDRQTAGNNHLVLLARNETDEPHRLVSASVGLALLLARALGVAVETLFQLREGEPHD